MKKEKRARARRTGAQAAESGAARPAGGAGKTLRALGFAQKLTLAMLLVLAMALSLGGAVVLEMCIRDSQKPAFEGFSR